MSGRRGGKGPRPVTGQKRTSRPTSKLSYSKLERLIEKEPEKILFTLRLEHSGFDNALNDDIISKDRMALILTAVGKACRCDQRLIVSSVLKKFISSSKFIYGNIQKYLCSLQNDGYDERHVESLTYLISILEELHKVLCAASSEIVSILLPLFKSTVEKICRQNGSNILSETLGKIEELEKENDSFVKLHFSGGGKSEEVSRQQPEIPPDDFRNIPVLPQDRDIFLNSDSFLRPAIKGGSYHNVDHYLDVHFRLLREDVIQPLRKGIQEYVIYQKANSKKPLTDVRLYRNVHIEKPVMLMSGLTHLISFEAKPFKHIVWESSKRLLFGSLLCLSHDNFKTMLFATVARRDSNKLKNGLLEVQFEKPREVFNFNSFTTFVMIETNAYFEAYRHVLLALQEMKDDTFPLKEYIVLVDVKSEIAPPQYLTQETTYNFQPLLVPTASNINEQIKLEEVTVLDSKMWPQHGLLGLDEHQLKALKTALSNQLAIIQGPPGTGKTYIGLKIVKLLLNNCNVWNSSEQLSPILVVCYTNHALDQFLEGILSFTDNIIRIGGRSTSPIMSAYQLNMLRSQLKNNHQVPEHIFHNINESKLQMKSVQQKVATTQRLIEAAKTTVLTVDVLKNYMEPLHYNSFISMVEGNFSPTLDRGIIMYEWLGLQSSKLLSIFPNNEESEDFDVSSEISVTEDTSESENECADVKYISDQRIVDVPEQEWDNQEMFDDHTLGTDFQRIQQFEKQMDSEWKVKGGYTERKNFIKMQLQLTDKMTKEEAKDLNIWKMDYVERWRLYRMWIEQYIKQNENSIIENQAIYEQFNKEFEEIRVEEDVHLMRNAKIVGMTTSGAAKYRNIVQKIKPPIIIVEEAAEVLEAHIIASLTTSTQHLILIGDHQQLRPSPTVYELARKFNLDISLFERMIKNGMNYNKLLVQHRMRPCISKLLVPHIYKVLHNHPSVQGYKDILGMEKNVFFVNHDFLEMCDEDSKSRRNVHEADFLIGLCKYLLLQGYSASQITILTMYTGQMFLIKKRMTNSISPDVRVSVVDNFQGEENDIILISFVRSNDEGNIGFLSISNRICVALSRAKQGLYCIGNFSLFAENNKTWEKIMSIVSENGMEGKALTLKCQIHQNKKVKITHGTDFVKKAPEGGCDSLCDFRLTCGHACTLSCHPYDREHKTFKCNKTCTKRCTKGHQCPKKCFEDCGPCLKSVLKQIPSCKHYISVPCSKDPTDVNCTEPCPYHLQCGHRCQGKCGKPCLSCNEMVKSSALCGHEVEIECMKSNNEWEKLRACKKACNKELDCGHLCKGSCSLCVQFRFHRACTERCNRILVCGHECKFPCAKNCPPCEEKCRNRCEHSRCPALCGKTCSTCNEKCNWRCQHMQCTRTCGDKCNRVACDKPCQKKLKCGHQCIGLCGERCPRLCRKCNKNEVTEIFFGNEDEPDAHFVQLKDCSHMFEVSGLTQYMEMVNEVQMKSCPKCKTVIRRSHRFGNIIKSCLKQIEMVKQKVSGSTSENKQMQKALLQKAELLDKENVKPVLDGLRKLSTCKIDPNIIDNITAKILCQLDENETPHAQSLTCIHNYLIFLEDLAKICQDFSLWYETIQNHKHSVEVMIWDFFSITIQTALKVMDENKSPTQQVISDINQEIRRLMVFNDLFQLVAKTRQVNTKSETFLKFYKKAVCILLTFGPLTNEDLKTANAHIVEASKHCDITMLGISDDERRRIVKAMGLTQGHWFSCPNGHVYCITECGGAMEEGKCNECQAIIGGHNHLLRGDNRLSGAMDGAQHAAWSEAANMQNYDL